MTQNTNERGQQAVADDILSNNDNSVNTDLDSTVKVDDSFQDNSDNSTDVDVDTDIKDSLNDNSTDVDTDVDVDVDVEDSLNDNSDNSDNSTNVSVEDAFKDQSDNSTNVKVEDAFKDQSDNSTHVDVADSFNTDNSTDDDITDSFKQSWDNSVRNQDSFNVTSSFNTQTLNDHSTTIGVRQYNSGFGDFNIGGLLGGGGAVPAAAGKHGAAGGFDLDVDIDNRSLQLDQSVSQAISTGDGSGVSQAFSQNATVAFGDDSIAAGRDVSIDNSVFEVKLGDVNVGNTAIDTRINDSFNDFSKNFDVELDVEVDDSFNDQSDHTNVDVDVEDSFTSEIDSTFSKSLEWENSGNFFSPGAATSGGEADVDF